MTRFAKDLDRGTTTHVVVSDVHVPYHDVTCCDAVADLMDDLRPDGLVIAGDFLDFEEVSSHNAGSLKKLEGKRIRTTYDKGNELLDQWDTAAGPQCTEKHLLDGNHEDRVNRWLASGDHAVFTGDDSVDIAKRLLLEDRGYEYHSGSEDEPACVELGHLLVTHGLYTNKFHAQRHLDEYRKSVLYGHTHSPQTVFGSAWGHQQVAVGLGYLGRENAPCFNYKKKPRRWAQGFALVHVHRDKTFNIVPLNFWNGQVIYGNRAYGKRRGAKAQAKAA